MSENENLTMEEAFEKLKSILDKLEAGDLTLEENFALYEEGLKLVKTCGNKLDMIEKKITILDEAGEQNPDEQE